MWLLMFWACTAEEPEYADTVFEGTVYVRPGEAVDRIAVSAGVVVATGKDALDRVGPDTEVVALPTPAYPGFTDNHAHLLAGSFVMDRLLLLGVSSLSSMVSSAESYADANPDEPWIVGYGWMRELVEADRELLDEAIPDRPVLLVDNSGHSALVNAVALERAGITADTPDPEDGEIVRGEDGEPTGLLLESALSLVSEQALGDYDDDALSGGLLTTLETFAEGGITGVQTILASPGFDLTRPWIYQDLETAGVLPVRIHYFVPVFSPDDIHTVAEIGQQYDGELVRLAGAKLWLDGSMGTGDSWMQEPLEGTEDDYGVHYFDLDELTQILEDAEDYGLSLKIHANGDGAVTTALDAFEAVAAKNGGLTQAHGLDHAVLIDPEDYVRIAELGIAINAQPSHWLGARSSDTVDQWGDERFDRAYDIRGVVDAGGVVSLGTDWPVWPVPAAASHLWAATAGRGETMGLTVDEALEAYTFGGAAALTRDDLGCLDVGCVADMTLFETDPATLDASELSTLEIEQVWVAGQRVE